MAAVIISVASALGMLIGFVAISFISTDMWEITLAYTYTTATDLSLAQGYANAFAIALWLLGNRLHTSGMMLSIYQDVQSCLQTHRRATLILVVGVFGCQLYLLNINVIVYGGNDLATEGEPTHPLLALITPLAPVVPFVLAYYARYCVQTRQWLVGLLIVGLLLGELSWFFLFGRRSVLYFFALLLAGFTYERVLTGKYIVGHIVPILLSILLILTIADTYHKLRTVYGFANLQRMSVVDGFRGLQAIDDDQYDKIRTTNMAFRSVYSSLAIGQFINLFRTTAHKPLAGKALRNSILLATPSDFLVDKKSVLAKEALYESTYALRLTDISETLYLESFIDFGWLGCFLYTGFISILFYGIYFVTNQYGSPLFSLVVCCMSIHLALSMVEMDMITYLATIRNLFLYYILTRLFFRKTVHTPLQYKTAESTEL
ncbi:hypothetical protein [Spirosoma pollinicola]|nr:hypothetical protein [Spirosoma pollinicola]